MSKIVDEKITGGMHIMHDITNIIGLFLLVSFISYKDE